jgi:hypothetical protein
MPFYHYAQFPRLFAITYGGENIVGYFLDRPCMHETSVDVSGCAAYTTGSEGQAVHSHWTVLKNWNDTVNMTMKLWNPGDWGSVKLRLALSVLPIPSTGSQLENWHAGVELVLSNRKSGIVAGGKVHHLQPGCPSLQQ